MTAPPYDHPLNLTTQSVLTFGSWSLTALFLAIAIAKDKRDGSIFYTTLVLAGLAGAYAEPLYDVGMTLWFYTPGIWSHFTAFDIPQPNWTHSGYVVLYSATAMFICQNIRNGLTATGLYCWFAFDLACSMAFEIIAINGGAYEYWGPHTFRVLEYPLAIGVLEATQATCYAVLAAIIRERASSNTMLLSLFLLFPAVFFMVNFGLGSPLIIALHWQTPAPLLVQFASIVSILGSLFAVYVAARVLPYVQTGATLQARPA
jgi:hypothetical protein